MERISWNMTVQGAGVIAPSRNLHPQTPRAPSQQLDAGVKDEFIAAATGLKPNRYDESIDRLRLAALRRDAAAAATSETAKVNTPTDDDGDPDRR